MKSKLKLWIFGAVSLLGLIIFILFVGDMINVKDEFRTLSLVGSMFLLYGGGSVCISMYIKRKQPKFYDKMIVEQSDERNLLIKNKAGRKAGETISYMNTALCLIFAICAKGLPYWVIFCQAGVTISYPILSGIFFSKYYKE